MNYEERLINILNFIEIICIEGGCGYDLKDILRQLIQGNYNYDEALIEWEKRGWYKF